MVPARIQPLLRTIGRVAQQQGARAYAVGGCVRDWALGIAETTDLDVTVEGSGIVLARSVGKTLRGRLTVHEQFGTATVRLGGRRVDFATCRRETYAKPAAYPKVSPGTLRDDLLRRDFTMNAMALALNPVSLGRLQDPFRGRQDLRRKTLRILHEKSFLDDPTRILRGVRFAERFGLRWDPKTFAQLRSAIKAGALGWLNQGRVRKELDLMLAEPNPRACLRHLASLFDPPGR